MRTMMIFVLIILKQGEPNLELYFTELTSCLEYRDALIHQSVGVHNWVHSKTKHFDGYCEVREILTSEAGVKYIFRDPKVKKDDG